MFKKLYIIVVFILFSSLSFSQRTNVIVKNDIFIVSYNEAYKQPNWVIYHINIANVVKNASRQGMNFYKVPGIITSSNEDYINNVYDKGHLAPAATFEDTKEHLYETFSYLNCSLQRDSLNRVTWEHLENYERSYLIKKYKSLVVKVVLDFSGKLIILKSGAHVPNGFYKQIITATNDTLTYYFPNAVLPHDFQFYKIKNKKI